MSGEPSAVPPASGTEWVVEAFGCSPEALRSRLGLGALFDRAVAELGLRAVAAPLFHAFPAPGGVTGVMLLAESHLTIHTFPESGYAALNLYCCRPRPAWDFAARLAEHLGAARVEVKALARGGLPPAEEGP